MRSIGVAKYNTNKLLRVPCWLIARRHEASFISRNMQTTSMLGHSSYLWSWRRKYRLHDTRQRWHQRPSGAARYQHSRCKWRSARRKWHAYRAQCSGRMVVSIPCTHSTKNTAYGRLLISWLAKILPNNAMKAPEALDASGGIGVRTMCWRCRAAQHVLRR